MNKFLKSASVAAVLMGATLLGSCDSDPAVLSTPLEGTWKLACDSSGVMNLGSFYISDPITDTWVFSQFSFTRTLTSYTDALCTVPWVTLVESGTFVTGSAASTTSTSYETYDLTMNYTSVKASLLDSAAVTAFNDCFGGATCGNPDSMCNTTWALSAPTDVSGAICQGGSQADVGGVTGNVSGKPGLPYTTKATYTTYTIDGTALQFGNTWTDTTPGTQPTNPGGAIYTQVLPSPQ